VSVININGLATGLDTDKIITALLNVERQPLNQLQDEMAGVQATKASVATLAGKLATLRGAADQLSTTDGVLVRRASSSDDTVLEAAAGAGAARGSLTVTVGQLAHASVAGATLGATATTSTIASGTGQLQFQVGAGDVQTVAVDATTTLQGLVDAINDLGAGVTASAVNLGTTDTPDYRLQIVSKDTGTANTIAILRDDTNLAVQTSQAGQDAQFTVSGFSGTFSRATNSFSDVLAGVTINLQSEGTATITVADDTDKIVAQAKALVAAVNDVVTFVAGESTVQENQDKSDVTVGSLATDTTVRRLVERVHEAFSGAFAGAAGPYVNLSSLGFATQNDGTIAFDETKFRAALDADPNGVAAVFAGNDTTPGIADGLLSLVDDTTAADGPLTGHTTALTDRINALQDQIDVGQRHLDTVESDLRLQFANLEALVGSLQSQSTFLSQAFGGGK